MSTYKQMHTQHKLPFWVLHWTRFGEVNHVQSHIKKYNYSVALWLRNALGNDAMNSDFVMQDVSSPEARTRRANVRSLTQEVEGHFNENDLWPASRALKKLCSELPSQVSTIQTADGCLVNEQRAHWAEYFEQLCMADPPRQLPAARLKMVNADSPIDITPPSLDEVWEDVAKLKDAKEAVFCNMSAELHRAGG